MPEVEFWCSDLSITLVGPGGAGKTTAGGLLGERLGIVFADLDRCFADREGDISEYINRFGYQAYARQTVETYRSLLAEDRLPQVIALSSGFMTYPEDVHPAYARLRRNLDQALGTVVLIPSLDRDICIAETVRRQLTRPFARSAEQEAAAIRERFPIYIGLRARKIETMRPLTAIVDELVAAAREAF